jgi:hypothetical protein
MGDPHIAEPAQRTHCCGCRQLVTTCDLILLQLGQKNE